MIEKDWTDLKTGLRCCVKHIAPTFADPWRCGYVEIPKNSPLFGVGYSEHVPFLSSALERVMRGTIGKRGVIPVWLHKDGVASMDVVFDVHGSVTYAGDLNRDGSWWVGFDCSHCYDTPEKWPLKAVIAETESLAKQIKEALADENH